MISVIVPSYNTKELLKQCLDSILSQTYADIEVLVIDNCSTDGTCDLIKNYEEHDCRVKGVIQKSSVTEARNIGLNLARGEFISFIDSDDLIVDSFMEKLVYMINSSKADVVLFNWFEVNGEKRKDISIAYPSTGTIMPAADAISYCITHVGEKINTYVWNKFYRRNCITKNNELIQFDTNLNYAEDALWLIKVMLNAKKAVFLNERLYGYRCGRVGNSTSTVWFNALNKNLNVDNIQSGVLAFYEISRLLEEYNTASNNALQKSLAYRINGMKVAVFLEKEDAFQFFKKNTMIMIWRYFIKDRTIVGLAWSLKKSLEYCYCYIKYLL